MDETELLDDVAGEAVLFENAEWRVTEDGMEHRRTLYFIARDVLGARRENGLWNWPLHLAEKGWCTPRFFREAFVQALQHFGIARDAHLAPSFAIGFGLRPNLRGGVPEGFVALGDVLVQDSEETKRLAVAA
ncbi:hypothetical protein [Methylobacterium organophilum]|uniref:Uncharacterized protein n=1 Tax=Methylobacterium organophilum TaxID=410 RepID=A0ABQ4TAE1_METOR|nr:hypothetical protein [Methylobacterium organophilum]UMY15775.1 hypothetical protein MMB17_13590 [Methylobacterium organophilum]GJE28193.1 hypothetical protein LKMONMHP_3060 [Methylobacterium organophilum]